MYIWEVATRENTLGKLSLGKRPLGKYLTSMDKYVDRKQVDRLEEVDRQIDWQDDRFVVRTSSSQEF